MRNSYIKKNFILLLALTASIPATLLAQKSPVADSLLTILKTAKEDTGKVNTLNDLCRQLYKAGKYPEAKKYAEDAISLSEKLNFERGKASAYNHIGVMYFYQGNYPEALNNYTTSLTIREKIGDYQGIANCYHNIAFVYHNQGNYPEALKNYLASIKAKEKVGDKDGMAKSYGNIGLIYTDQRHYSEALKNHIKSLKLFEELKDKNAIAVTINNIGIVYENQGNHAEALKYYLASLKLYAELGDKSSMSNRYFNIGFLYEAQGNFPEALKNHFAALKIGEETGNIDCQAVSHNNIGYAYFQQAKASTNPSTKDELFQKSMNEYFLSLKGFKEEEDNEGIAGAYTQLGAVFFELKDFRKARKYLNDGLILSKENEIIEDIKKSYEHLAKLDSATGDWEGAFRNQKLYIRYRDSLVNEESSRKLMQAQMQFDFDKKEDSLNYQQELVNAKFNQQILSTQKQKQAKNYFLAGLVLLALLFFFVYRNYHTRQQLKLQKIRNRIASDLHDDVGSTLSSISIFSQMAQQQSKEVIPLLETIEENSREMLDAMADIVWTINPENDQFEQIILRMRSFAFELLGAKKIDFEFSSDDEVSKLKLPMDVRKNLYLIFKEATNNLVKYSSANKAMFTIKGEKHNLMMMIRDNGSGFDIQKSNEGNGLKNMRKRALEIGAQLLIDSNPGNGTTIQLNVSV